MINVRMQHKEVQKLTPKITVLGIGGAGGNAVNNMINSDLQGVEFVVCNTDAQALEGSMCETKIQLGTTVTGGLGAGAKPEVGREAAEESLDDVMRHLEGANMAFITAGMGGGTGTGAAPVIARACREMGILTVGVVTKPFHFEGTLRMKLAEEGIEEMQGYVDTLIVIPNQNLFRVANDKTTFAEAFKMADSVLQSGVRGVTDLMVMPGLINLDFADVRSVMSEMGKAMMGTGEAEGEKRPQEAAEKAINNPLLDEVSMKGAHGVIINVTGGSDMTLYEVDEACNQIRDEVDPNANIIFGSTFDERMEGRMRVSIVATGVDSAEQRARSGGSVSPSVNARSGQGGEKKLERAQPNTASGAAAEEPKEKPAASFLPHQPQVILPQPSQQPKPMQSGYTPLRVSVPESVAAPQGGSQSVTAKKIEEEAEGGMFEQQEFAVAESGEAEQKAAFPQASIYNNAFIPPKPLEPARQDKMMSHSPSPSPSPVSSDVAAEKESAGSSGYGPQWEELSARRESKPGQAEKSSASLNLRPPVPGASAAEREKHKAPSLFERITNNPLWNPSGGEKARPAAEGQDRKSAAPQGKLNIDAPKNTGGQNSSEDELDIPAFLRRQAN